RPASRRAPSSPRRRRTGPATAAPRASRRSRLGAQSASDDHLLHLIGALSDGEDLGVAVEAAHRVLLDIAVAAVDLDRLLGAADGQAPCLELRLGGGQGELRLAVLEARGLVDEQPAGLDLGAHVGELALDGLELRDRLPERLALAGVGERLVERALREPDAHGGDADPPDVE